MRQLIKLAGGPAQYEPPLICVDESASIAAEQAEWLIERMGAECTQKRPTGLDEGS